MTRGKVKRNRRDKEKHRIYIMKGVNDNKEFGCYKEGRARAIKYFEQRNGVIRIFFNNN